VINAPSRSAPTGTFKLAVRLDEDYHRVNLACGPISQGGTTPLDAHTGPPASIGISPTLGKEAALSENALLYSATGPLLSPVQHCSVEKPAEESAQNRWRAPNWGLGILEILLRVGVDKGALSKWEAGGLVTTRTRSAISPEIEILSPKPQADYT
jgi:hypothetical protein